jgi:hypothetical protein
MSYNFSTYVEHSLYYYRHKNHIIHKTKLYDEAHDMPSMRTTRGEFTTDTA